MLWLVKVGPRAADRRLLRVPEDVGSSALRFLRDVPRYPLRVLDMGATTVPDVPIVGFWDVVPPANLFEPNDLGSFLEVLPFGYRRYGRREVAWRALTQPLGDHLAITVGAGWAFEAYVREWPNYRATAVRGRPDTLPYGVGFLSGSRA